MWLTSARAEGFSAAPRLSETWDWLDAQATGAGSPLEQVLLLGVDRAPRRSLDEGDDAA